MRGAMTSILLVAVLVLGAGAEPYGYRRFAGSSKQRFAGLGKQRFSGLGRHAARVADSIRGGASQGASDNFEADDYKMSFGDYEADTGQLSGRRNELKHFLQRQQHHKAMMKSKRLNGRNEICLFKGLRRCGNHLISELSSDAGFDSRCTSKEDFLDCMSRMQHGSCHVKHVRHGPSRALVQQYQQRLRRLLRATRGCVIGIDLSTDAN